LGVAVRATDLALRHLDKNGRPTESSGAHVRDVVALVAEMIELEDRRISLAAVNPWVPRSTATHVAGSRRPFGPELS
jgi:hypothetical protein